MRDPSPVQRRSTVVPETGSAAANAGPERPTGADAARPRVTFVVTSLRGGGAERTLVGLARHLLRGGRDVSVVTLGAPGEDAYRLDPGVHRVRLDLLGRSRNVADAVLQTSRRIVALRRTLARLRPDVVVSLISTTNVLSLLATAGTGVPVLACEHSEPRLAEIGRTWGLLRRLTYPRAAAVVVLTEEIAAWARRFCTRVQVIPNSVERPREVAAPGAAEGPRRLVAMGRLEPVKGFDLLVEAFSLVAARHPGWSLQILGEGSERARLEALADRLGLSDRVSLPGRVEDPVPHLARAHAFVLSSRHEAFPNALLEAMACGLPPVAYDCPSGPRAIITHGRNGLLVKAGDVPLLAATLDRLMGDPAERVRLGREAREMTVLLAPERVVERWNALLRAVGA